MNLEPTWRVKDIVLPEEHEQVKEEPVEHTPRPKITSEERDVRRSPVNNDALLTTLLGHTGATTIRTDYSRSIFWRTCTWDSTKGESRRQTIDPVADP